MKQIKKGISLTLVIALMLAVPAVADAGAGPGRVNQIAEETTTKGWDSDGDVVPNPWPEEWFTEDESGTDAESVTQNEQESETVSETQAGSEPETEPPTAPSGSGQTETPAEGNGNVANGGSGTQGGVQTPGFGEQTSAVTDSTGNGSKDTDTSKVTVKKAKIKKLKRSANNKKATVKIKKIKGVSGYRYQIQYSTKKNFKKKFTKTKNSKKIKKVIKKLKPGKKYYVRVRAFVTVEGVRCYGKWSKVKKVKVRK